MFGARTFVHIPKECRKGKFAKREKTGYIVLFYCGNPYRAYYPEEGRVVISRDVSFDESICRTTVGTPEQSKAAWDFVSFDNPLTFVPIHGGHEQLTSM